MDTRFTDKKKQNPIIAFFSKIYARFLKIRGTPNAIGLGFALGLFVGMTPFMGIQTPIAIFFAALFKWNKISSAAGVWISNPVSAPVIYGINFFIGAKIIGLKAAATPSEHAGFSLIKLIQGTPEILVAMIIGGIVTGIPLAVMGYFFSFSAVKKYQQDIKAKIAQKKEQRVSKKKKKKKVRHTTPS